MVEKKSNSRIADEFAAKIQRETLRSRIIDIAPIAILIGLCIVMSIIAEGFFTLYSFRSVLNQLAIPLVLSMGITFVILMGGIDLSCEGVMGFVGSVVCLLVLNNKNTNDFGFFAIIIVLVASTIIGLVSGIIHVKVKLPSFMVTYAISSIMTGFAVLSYKGIPAAVTDPAFDAIAQGSFLGLPIITWISLCVFAVAYLIQERTRFGSYIFAIGDNETVVKNTGINIEKIKIAVFGWSGFCIGIAGILGAIRIGRGDVVIGSDTVFPAITAIVVGGTSLSGGRGGVVNSLVGALIVTVINHGLILLGVNPYIQAAVQGVIIICAVSISVVRGKKIITK